MIRSPNPWVVPTETDLVARAALPLLGGPIGRHAAVGRSWWTPVRVCILAGMLTYAIGWLSKGWCVLNGWGAPQRYMYLCYSDIPLLYQSRGLADGVFPYLLEPGPGQQVLEYPVLIGVLLYGVAQVTRLFGGQSLMFFAVTAIVMAALFAWTIVSVSRAVPRRPWDAMLLSLAPVVALAAFINWDLLAISLTAAAFTALSRDRSWAAGIWLGLAAAAKFYPLILIGPIFVHSLRSADLRKFWRFLGGLTGAWLAVNLPVMVLNWDGWLRFYAFSRERGVDFGSLWYALELVGVELSEVNGLAMGSFLVACLCVGLLGMFARVPPRLASLAFLVLGAFVLTNKVYSPQYVLWVLPFAVLARPRWRDLLIWQAGEVLYFLGIWWYLVGYGTTDRGLHPTGYVLAIAVHWLVTAWLMAMVVRDVLVPGRDPVLRDNHITRSPCLAERS